MNDDIYMYFRMIGITLYAVSGTQVVMVMDDKSLTAITARCPKDAYLGLQQQSNRYYPLKKVEKEHIVLSISTVFFY